MCYITRLGKVRALLVFETSSYLFSESAKAALVATPCEPALEGVLPMGAFVTIPFIFRLR